MNAFTVSTITALIAFAPAALAWNDYGHNLAASIAYRELKPEVKARVDATLKEHVQYSLLSTGCPKGFDQGEWVFMRAATWPDMVRSDKNPHHRTDHRPKWHYINFPINLDGKKGPEPKVEWKKGAEPENAVQALAKVEAGLKDENQKAPEKAKDLSWFLHLASDLHQPLHGSNLYSNQYPSGDQGGNAFWVRTDAGMPVKLHALWDQCLGTSKNMKDIADRGAGLVVRKDLTRTALAPKLKETEYRTWAVEGRDLAKSVAYQDGKVKGALGTDENKPKDAPLLPAGYFRTAEKLAEQQIVLAGYRIADKLNTFTAGAE
ncbi:MAG TPA: S1/P1 nuclease [Phycisphaerales bacterium]|nr:S1/P1 nuclease [Phycisphaerales bacterium]